MRASMKYNSMMPAATKRERLCRRSDLLMMAGLLFFAGWIAWNTVVMIKLDARQRENRRDGLRGVRPHLELKIDSSSLGSNSTLLLPASVWATRKLPDPATMIGLTNKNVSSLLTANETKKALELCGKFLYSTLHRAIHLKNMGQDVFVATGDIDAMWIRDSVVQMSIYLKHIDTHPWLRFIVDGAIRRNAFNILQDPYANAYEHYWKNPAKLAFRDQIIGRGGFVATRNYELDSGAYFLNHLYDYYLSSSSSSTSSSSTIHKPEALLQEPMVFDAVMTMINVWIVEQRHDELSPYRYYELPNEGKGSESAYTGMTWTGFRPSDDPCTYGYLIPANIHAAAALERTLILNDRIWQSDELSLKASKLLKEIEDGINTFGIVKDEASGLSMYAYEVDGRGNKLVHFDDANVPSLLSIPLLGWNGYNKDVYDNTRKYLLSKSNKWYFEGSKLKGIGSPHTPQGYIWPMALVIQGLTEEGPDMAEKMVFQMRQLLLSATGDAMHESVHEANPSQVTRQWFEWANALFVVYVETVLGTSCAPSGSDLHRSNTVETLRAEGNGPHMVYQRSSNDLWNPLYYQDIEASIHFE